jgi:tetratricopeptide (TPR) repeat protein
MLSRFFGAIILVAGLLIALLLPGPGRAQIDTLEFVTNTPAAPIPLLSPVDAAGQITVSLPDSVRLSGLSPVYQQVNRCSAAALTIALSYYNWDGTYTDTINYLNTYAEDVAVRLDEMVAFVEQHGLRAVERTGGTIDLLRLLVASGYPVLVENSYYEGGGGFRDWMGHNRVVMGYDDASATFYTFDSLLGNGPDNTGRPLSYTELDDRWRAFNRDYLIIYRPEQEAEIMALLGPHADRASNWRLTLEQAEAEIASIGDGFAYFNAGSALLGLGRAEEAAALFDRAFAAGLPWRMLWYQYGPFEAYLLTGRYDDVLRLVQDVRRTTGGVEEVFYYAGLAHELRGEIATARTFFEVAAARNRHYAPPRLALERLDAAAQSGAGLSHQNKVGGILATLPKERG